MEEAQKKRPSKSGFQDHNDANTVCLTQGPGMTLGSLVPRALKAQFCIRMGAIETPRDARRADKDKKTFHISLFPVVLLRYSQKSYKV